MYLSRLMNRLTRIHRIAIVMVIAVASLPGSAEAQGITVENYGDWELRCDTPAGAQYEQCFLFQWVQASDRDNIGLAVLALKTADQTAQILRVLAPLGILLPAGVGLSIDDTEIGRAEYVRCQVEGCMIEVLLGDDLLGQLRSGDTASFTIYATPEEGIVVPVSLAGFAEGFDALP